MGHRNADVLLHLLEYKKDIPSSESESRLRAWFGSAGAPSGPGS